MPGASPRASRLARSRRSSSSGLIAGGYAVEPSLGVSARRSLAGAGSRCREDLRFV